VTGEIGSHLVASFILNGARKVHLVDRIISRPSSSPTLMAMRRVDSRHVAIQTYSGSELHLQLRFCRHRSVRRSPHYFSCQCSLQKPRTQIIFNDNTIDATKVTLFKNLSLASRVPPIKFINISVPEVKKDVKASIDLIIGGNGSIKPMIFLFPVGEDIQVPEGATVTVTGKPPSLAL
jgi:hypothetical protein